MGFYDPILLIFFFFWFTRDFLVNLSLFHRKAQPFNVHTSFNFEISVFYIFTKTRIHSYESHPILYISSLLSCTKSLTSSSGVENG